MPTPTNPKLQKLYEAVRQMARQRKKVATIAGTIAAWPNCGQSCATCGRNAWEHGVTRNGITLTARAMSATN